MKVIQVILYLTLVSRLAYCHPIKRDLDDCANISRDHLNCSSDEVLEDIRQFNNIFIQLHGDGHSNIKISDETMDFLNNKSIDNPTDQLEEVIGLIYQNFSATCRRHIDVMGHKHELQNAIFTMENSSSNINVTATVTDITHVMIQLERAASKLQSMTLKHYNEPCVEFTGDQYHDIYAARFHNKSNVYYSLAFSVTHWGNTTDNCNNWKKYS